MGGEYDYMYETRNFGVTQAIAADKESMQKYQPLTVRKQPIFSAIHHLGCVSLKER